MNALGIDLEHSHLLKLLTGVDTSTLEVKRSGSEGNATKRNKRTATAAANRAAFPRSTGIL